MQNFKNFCLSSPTIVAIKLGHIKKLGHFKKLKFLTPYFRGHCQWLLICGVENLILKYMFNKPLPCLVFGTCLLASGYQLLLWFKSKTTMKVFQKKVSFLDSKPSVMLLSHVDKKSIHEFLSKATSSVTKKLAFLFLWRK